MRSPHIYAGAWAIVLVGCAADQTGLQVRAIADPATGMRAGGAELAQAQAWLGLGNAGLALEAFRKIQRGQPSAEALAGIADCYSAMGRLDLAKANYEAALAMAPENANMLTALAAILDRQGHRLLAAQTRAEATGLMAKQAQASSLARSTTAAVEMTGVRVDRLAASVGSITVTLPAAHPMEASQAIEHFAAVNPMAPPTVELARSASLPPVASLPHRAPALSSTITIALPPARPASVSSPRQIASNARPLVQRGPRLERLSLGEVALVTTTAPTRGANVASRRLAPTLAQWLPVENAAGRPNIRVLNAARHQGLANAAKALLATRGWRKIEIGDARVILERSVVYYPPRRRQLARSLAAQFGIRAVAGKNGVLVVMLGRDSALRRAGWG